MDYQKILRTRYNRRTRKIEPFLICNESIDQCIKAGNAILDGNFKSDFTPLVERSIVITSVTAIEVYYRDVLDWVFRYCEPAFFEPKLKMLHNDKYDINDLLTLHDNHIHPLELVSNSQSFQSIDGIERVFSKFTGKGFWSTIFEWQVRRKENPENVVTWDKQDLDGLRATFALRHELVHDPAKSEFLTPDVIANIGKSAHMVWGSNFVLMQMMADNRDPSLNEQIT